MIWGAGKLLNPNELLGLLDVEPGEKANLPTVEAIEANKIDKLRTSWGSCGEGFLYESPEQSSYDHGLHCDYFNRDLHWMVSAKFWALC